MVEEILNSTEPTATPKDMSELDYDIEAPELKQALDEAINGYRTFDAEGFGMVKIRFANADERQQAEREYAKVFTALLKEGELLTEVQMLDVLERRGIWTDYEKNKAKDLGVKIQDLLAQLARATKSRKRQSLLDEIRELNQEVDNLATRKDPYMEQTIEAKADEIKIGWLLSLVATNAETGEKLWKSYDEFLKESRLAGAQKIVYEWMTFTKGIPSSFFESLPAGLVPLDESGE